LYLETAGETVHTVRLHPFFGFDIGTIFPVISDHRFAYFKILFIITLDRLLA